jgi:hypothetical protein
MSTQQRVPTDEAALAPAGVEEWREWLALHGRTEKSVWVVVHR